MSLRSTAETMRPWRSCRCVHGECEVHQEELRKLSILYGIMYNKKTIIIYISIHVCVCLGYIYIVI